MFPPETKFLIVDDFSTMRKIIKKMLFQIGFNNLHEAEDGLSAFMALESAYKKGIPFDFVLSDWNMPAMSGVDLLKKCRKDPRFSALPFMLVTTESEQQHILEAAQAGASEYLVKPFKALAFQKKLESCWLKNAPESKTKAS